MEFNVQAKPKDVEIPTTVKQCREAMAAGLVVSHLSSYGTWAPLNPLDQPSDEWVQQRLAGGRVRIEVLKKYVYHRPFVYKVGVIEYVKFATKLSTDKFIEVETHPSFVKWLKEIGHSVIDKDVHVV